MSRTSLGLCALLFLSLATYGCGGDDSSSTDAAMSTANDGGGVQAETGSGIGRGRGGGLGEADAGPSDGPNADGAVADASVPKLDAMVKLDAGTACENICAPIRTRYLAAVNAAKSCRTTSRAQCEASVAPDLYCAGCNVRVNDATGVSSIGKEWLESGCGTCNLGKCIRPLIACLATTGSCKPNTATTFATVPAVGTIPIDPGVVIYLNDGMCITESSRLLPL